MGSNSSSSIYGMHNFGKLLNVSGPQFSHLKNGDKNSTPSLGCYDGYMRAVAHGLTNIVEAQ